MMQRRYPKLNSSNYNVTQIRNAVRGDEYAQRLTDPHAQRDYRGFVGFCLIMAVLFIALAYGAFDWLYVLFQ